MGTYNHFRIISNKKIKGIFQNEYYIKTDKELYKEGLEKLVRQFKRELNDIDDIDDFIKFLRKKGINAEEIDLCFIENYKPKPIKQKGGSFIVDLTAKLEEKYE